MIAQSLLPPNVKLPATEPTGFYADWVARTKFEDLPPEIVDQSKRLILDTLACMVGAANEDCVWQSRQYMKHMGGRRQARVVYFGTKMPVAHAAFVNGVMARCLDMGDVEREATHSSEFIVPAILSGADYLKSNGKELITAMAVGTEILARMGHGCRAASVGVYQMSMLPPFVAIALVYPIGKLYGLSSEKLWDAAGLAFSTPSGTDTQSTSEGRSSGKRMMHGFVAQNAMTCVNLAKMGGIKATRKIFFGKNGVVQTFYPYKCDPEIFTKDLGKLWVAEIVQKKYPSCIWNHAPYEGTFELMKENDIKVEAIASLEYETGYLNVVAPKEEKWNPQTMQAAQFSLPYFVATSLLKKGAFFVDDYRNEALTRKDVRELMTRIKATYNPELSQKEKGNARLRMTLKDGRVFAWKDIPYAPGHPKKPQTWDDLSAKFRACADWVDFPKNNQDKIIKLVKKMEAVEDMSKLSNLLICQERDCPV